MKILTYVSIYLIATTCTSNSGTDTSENVHQDLPEVDVVESSVDHAEPDPQIAVDFINAYIDNVNKMGKSQEIREWIQSSEFVTTAFKTELVKLVTKALEKEPEVGLNYDPILNAQDYPEEGFELTNFDKERGMVTVSGIDWSSFTLNIKLVTENGRTLVDGCGVVNVPD